MLKRYVTNVLIGLDQAINAILGGWPDETLSSRLGRSNCTLCRFACKLLDRIDPRHCPRSVRAERDRAQQAPALRK